MSKSVPWAKIWWSWYTSRSHVGLSGVALSLGAPLILIARAYAKRQDDAQCDAGPSEVPDVDRASDVKTHEDLVWILNESGKPVTARHLANVVRFPASKVQSALDELVECGTLVVDERGCYGFRNFWKYQESASAARNRRYLERHRDADNDADVTPESVDGDGQREEGRGKREDKRESVEPKARKPRSENLALSALKAALKTHHATPPALSKSLGDKACGRLRDAVSAKQAPDLDSAADALVRAHKASPRSGNVWALLDVPFSASASAPKSHMGRVSPI